MLVATLIHIIKRGPRRLCNMKNFHYNEKKLYMFILKWLIDQTIEYWWVLYDMIWYEYDMNMIWYDMISYHIISYHITSHHIISYHGISYHMDCFLINHISPIRWCWRDLLMSDAPLKNVLELNTWGTMSATMPTSKYEIREILCLQLCQPVSTRYVRYYVCNYANQ